MNIDHGICQQCQKEFHLDLLDVKIDKDISLFCKECYGPGWNPMIEEERNMTTEQVDQFRTP
jgi:excinuclease UvrABC ATPase subunit